MKKVVNALRKFIVALVGFVVLAIGLILIPLPGPGILIVVAGLAILAIEFEWAKRHHQRIKDLAAKAVKKLKKD